MNDVINPFQITHPTSIQTSLLATALFSKFDPSGRWIAAGKQNGSVVIWDLNTRAPVRVLDGHVRAVTSIDWSRYGRYVLTSSKDWNVIVWDLAERLSSSMRLSAGCIQRMKTVRFDSSVMCASFHPRNSKIILVLLSTGELFITDLRREYRGRVELCDTLFQVRERELRERENREREKDKLEEGEEGETVGSSVPPLPMREAKRSPITVARFDIFGEICVCWDCQWDVISVQYPDESYFTRNGRRLVTNSSDRILRQFTIPNYQATTSTSTTSSSSSHNNNSSGYSTPTLATATTALNVNEQELEPTHRFNDPINKTAWHVMAYSPDGEWLAGGKSPLPS
ncbi:hypothetical protein NP233_g10648 [Leucocoprinus birnbaumii]|uniref:WD40 repeat-like protein n=1 Tax=Leucocoprinus birnbaumii TaxID=56174 RepID=A0AAD5YRQ1_9AGAR|nr:hypothetical protein NP233_g10648 [Leucocoprinus birnbaumii]